jgi:hypothetical protein
MPSITTYTAYRALVLSRLYSIKPCSTAPTPNATPLEYHLANAKLPPINHNPFLACLQIPFISSFSLNPQTSSTLCKTFSPRIFLAVVTMFPYPVANTISSAGRVTLSNLMPSGRTSMMFSIFWSLIAPVAMRLEAPTSI